MNNVQIMNKTVDLLNEGKELALVTIIAAQGSTPRGLGSNMLVVDDGTVYGTIGGGAMEKKAIDFALQSIKDGESQSLEIFLETTGVEMICGGEVEIFVNVYKNRPKLLIAGGGHVAHALYKQASLLDFDIVVFEDREEFLTEERFPKASQRVLGDIAEELTAYPKNDQTYIVIVSRAHEFDERCLEGSIDSPATYIGMMGSTRKVKTIRGNLVEKGISEDKLKKVHAPIGLDICNGTPAEIALAIMSEILLVKNQGSLRHANHDYK